MNNTLLVTRPSYDDATGYLFSYAGLVLNYANNHNIKNIDLKKPRLTRNNFESIISKKDPKLIFFNAHGNEKSIYGDKINKKEEILVQENKNHSILMSRIIYARACLAAVSLGNFCTKEGKGCFIGYETPFSFWIDERWSSKPLNDKTAKLFLYPSNEIVISLLKGNSAHEAFNKSLDMSKKNILELLKIKKEPGAMASIMLLWTNIQGQVILGEKDIKFT